MRTANTLAIALSGVFALGTLGGATLPTNPAAEDPYPPPEIPAETWETRLINLLTYFCGILGCNASSDAGDGANAAATQICQTYYANGIPPNLTQEQILTGIADAQTTLLHLVSDPGVLSPGVHDELRSVIQQIKADLNDL